MIESSRSSIYDAKLKEQLSEWNTKTVERIQRTLLRSLAPNAETSFNLKVFKKENDFLDLAIASWYLEGFFGELLREELRTIACFQNLKTRWIFEILLSSKEEMLKYLSSYSERIFFGNLLGNIKKQALRCKFKFFNQETARRVVRRRGYRDKGSCRSEYPSNDRWIPTFDWSLTELQNSIEREEQFLANTSNSIRSFGLLGVRLPELEV